MVERRVFCGGIKGKNLRYLEDGLTTGISTSNVGFVLLEHFSLPAFTQALDTLVTANLIRPSLFKTHTFTLNGEEVVSDLGIVIRPDSDLKAIPLESLKLLVLCGGLRTPLKGNQELRNLLKRAAEKGIALAGLWNGAWFFGHAGLLDGYRCAIHPEHRPALAEIAKYSQVTSESYMVDRDRYTAASPAGAFHVVLDWIGQMQGSALVEGIVDILAFEESRFKRINPKYQFKMTEPLRETIKLMEANLEEPLELAQISSYVRISRRQIERLFSEQLGTSPLRYYLELRLTEARRLLQHSTLSIVQVSVACGFISSSHFSKRYSSYFGHSPSREKRLEF
ncbi:GlxA family transcriptional regulator [Pseudomonas sp. LRF_L74]|uniref:GlxA family transcriptional regulator n=1 Tax=Pseudomonas sp. LRF_L74 TaxID=3369422 RepID=UPI003F60875C